MTVIKPQSQPQPLAASPTPAGATLPDLVVHDPTLEELEKMKMKVRQTDEGNFLSYGIGVANRGAGHMVILGERPTRDSKEFQGKQVAFAGGTPVLLEGGKPVFTLDRDHRHNHWHVKDTFAFHLEKDGMEGWSFDTTKSHFWMINSGAAENPLPRGEGVPSNDQLSREFEFDGQVFHLGGNTSDKSRIGQVLYQGTFDYYRPSLNTPFKLPDNPNGWYTLDVTTDPNNMVVESDETNNTSTFRIRIEDGSVVEVTKV